jgi:hypothetical protein
MAMSSSARRLSIACDRCDREMKLVEPSFGALYAYECANGHRSENIDKLLPHILSAAWDGERDRRHKASPDVNDECREQAQACFRLAVQTTEAQESSFWLRLAGYLLSLHTRRDEAALNTSPVDRPVDGSRQSG